MIKKINGKEFFIFYRENTSDIKIIKERQQYFNKDFFSEPGEIWLDAGGNIGLTKMLFTSFGNECISLEPLPENFKYLQMNSKENNLKGNNLMAGLGVKNERVNFYYPSDGDYWRSTTINHYKKKEMLQTEVQIFGLDNFDVNCLKMDIEGSEIEILENCYLNQFRKIVFEYHFDKDKRISRFMNIIERIRNFGFQVRHAKIQEGIEEYNFFPAATIVRAWK